MKIGRIKQLVSTAREIHNYLRSPMTVTDAMESIRVRMDNRENNFLEVARNQIYGNQDSPYQKLLLWAGCRYKDLEDSVRTHGIKKTLEQLRDEGVYLTLEEFKSKVPINRRGLTIETREPDFDNPFLTGKGIQGSSSGSRSKGTRVTFGWDFFAEGAAHELLLNEIHGVADAPLAIWLPGLSSAGFLNLLTSMKFHRPPEKWFTHVEMGEVARKKRLIVEYISWYSRMFGMRVPRPEFTDLSNAAKVAEWMAKTKKDKGICLVRTYASSAVRIAQAAYENSIDIRDSVIFTGAEPLTERRHEFIESAGVKAYARYVASEAGWIAASCNNRTYPDDMHVYLDRLAIIHRLRKTAIGQHDVNTFLFTSLSPNAGKVLFNTEIGDFGRLTISPCSCLYGKLGMDVRISQVRSHDKLTSEGMTLLGSGLDEIVGELVVKAGGCPDDYQFWETQDDKGLSKLVIAVNPDLHNIHKEKFISDVMERIRLKTSNITSQMWKQADLLQVVHARPEMTKGYKMLSIKKKAITLP